MKYMLLWLGFVTCLIWRLSFTLLALLMSTGLADEPGDTNGFRRLLIFWFIGTPGVLGVFLVDMQYEDVIG